MGEDAGGGRGSKKRTGGRERGGKYWEGGMTCDNINVVTEMGYEEEEDRGLIEKYKSWSGGEVRQVERGDGSWSKDGYKRSECSKFLL